MKIIIPPCRKARIEMIPLIDMIFLLLASFIFAFITMTVHKGIPVKLPYASTSVEDKEEYVSITVTKEDEIYINKLKVDFEDIFPRLALLKEKDPDARVYLSADQEVTYKRIVAILDVLRKANFQKVSLETWDRDE